MPTGWDLIGMSFVQGLTSTVNNTLNAFVSRALDTQPKDQRPKPTTPGYTEPNPGVASPQQSDNRKTYAKAPLLMSQVRLITQWTRVSGPHYTGTKGQSQSRAKLIRPANGAMTPCMWYGDCAASNCHTFRYFVQGIVKEAASQTAFI